MNFWNKTTPEVARDLLGMYLEHDTPEGRLAGYIVDAEAYLGPEDEAAHSYGLRRTPRVRQCMKTRYDLPLHDAYSSDFEHHYSARRIPQGVMIRAIEPAAMIDQMSKIVAEKLVQISATVREN